MQSLPFPCYLVSLRPKYSPQHSILKHPQPTKERGSCIEIRKQWESLIELLINVLNEANRLQDHNINYNLSFHYCSTDVM